MSKELVISANRHETKVALIEDDQLCEVYFQRANEYSLAGSIHKGRVTRVLPGMQSAFVDLGLERDTFLYVSDFLEEHEDFDKVTGEERPPREPREREPRREGRDRDARDRDARDRDGRDREGGDRDTRDRDRHSTPPPAVQSAPRTLEITEADGSADPSVTASASPESSADDRGADRGPDRGGDRGDRRGRRSRRRRNGGRGFPDSKYASSGAEQRQSGPQSQFRQPAPAAELEKSEEAGPLSVSQPASDDSSPLILPGESLKKYRDAPAPLPEREVADDPEVMEAVEELEEPIRFPAENALPDAPAHPPEPVAGAAPPPLPEEYVAAHPRPAREIESEGAASPTEGTPPLESSEKEELAELDAAEEAAEENEGGPAIAPGLDEEEDRDIQAMILGDIDGIDTVEEGSESPDAQPGQEAAGAPPESGTASVRDRGGRFPHRGSRRNRRRRGGPSAPALGQAVLGQTGLGHDPTQTPSDPAAPESVRPEFTREARPQQQVVSRPSQGQPSISELLKEGQEIIVQIAKEPLGQKGARITSHIALPGRYVVYMPTLEHMGVSRKIASDEERLRLKRILQAKRPGPVGGFITRTAAEGRSEEDIAGDMQFLYNLWQDIKTRADKRSAPMLLHHDLDIVQRILRDQLADSFKAIWIDNEEHYESVLRFVERFQPALVPKVKLYTREAPIFDAFGVTAELEKALRPKVWLKSGGYIVINQTEALVAIDVNTGKYVGKSNRLEDTIVKTNTEAIKEIVRQTRLRDLGGIIVIDFIDMDERKNRQKVMQVLEETMRADRAPYKILQFNDFGLVAITRKRVKQSLERTLCSPCPHCEGAGYVKSVQTVVSEILTEARKMARSVDSKDVMLRVHPDVAKVLKSHQNKFLEELEEILRRPVLIKSDPLLHQEKFDLA